MPLGFSTDWQWINLRGWPYHTISSIFLNYFKAKILQFIVDITLILFLEIMGFYRTAKLFKPYLNVLNVYKLCTSLTQIDVLNFIIANIFDLYFIDK